jgi:hypothetical protein
MKLQSQERVKPLTAFFNPRPHETSGTMRAPAGQLTDQKSASDVVCTQR